jgi:hypothetical protein
MKVRSQANRIVRRAGAVDASDDTADVETPSEQPVADYVQPFCGSGNADADVTASKNRTVVVS